MASDTIDPVFFEPTDTATRPELLVSAVLHLMSHYNVNAGTGEGCTRLASVIERHLKALADLPDLAPVLRATCQQLSEQWGGVVEQALRPASRRERFLWLVKGLPAS